MTAARAAVVLLVAAILPGCGGVEPVPDSERPFRAELARVTDLRDLVPLLLRTPDDQVLFEQSHLRLIELACGRAARRQVDDFLDLCETRLRNILREQPPTSAGKLYWALKGLWLDLDLQFREAPGTREGSPQKPEDVSLRPLALRREGRCGSFSQFFMCMGERLKLPVSFVRAPRHAFIRIRIDGKELNFETNLPVWAKERTNAVYRDYFGGPGSPMDGHPFYLRSLTKRQAAIDSVADEIAAIWFGEGRYADILALCDAAEPAMGPDAFLERRFGARYYAGMNPESRELRDGAAFREALKLAERLQSLSPSESVYSILALRGYHRLLNDAAKAREMAEEILRNPRMSAEARSEALQVLKEP